MGNSFKNCHEIYERLLAVISDCTMQCPGEAGGRGGVADGAGGGRRGGPGPRPAQVQQHAQSQSSG